jgi:hypothetical protein
MRSFAHVEHPHFRQRPVPLIAAESHRSHDRQVASRVESVSASVGANPLLANLATAPAADLTWAENLGIRSAWARVFSPAAMQARQFPAWGLPP